MLFMRCHPLQSSVWLWPCTYLLYFSANDHSQQLPSLLFPIVWDKKTSKVVKEHGVFLLAKQMNPKKME